MGCGCCRGVLKGVSWGWGGSVVEGAGMVRWGLIMTARHCEAASGSWRQFEYPGCVQVLHRIFCSG